MASPRAKVLGLMACALLACNERRPTTASGSPPQDASPPVDVAPDAAPARSEVDRPDEASGYQVHVMYVVPSDGVDRGLDIDGTIARSVASMDKWLRAQTGGAGLRLDTFAGALDITFVRLSEANAAIASRGAFVRDFVQELLMKQRFSDARKVYAVYYDGASTFSCGGGAWPPTLVGHVAALYLQGTPSGAPPCNTNPIGGSEPGYVEFSLVHEVLHTIGIVGTCAPHHTRAGHTSDDPRDLMYAGDAPWKPSILDLGRDDYYGHGRSDCVDLAKSVFLDPLPAGATTPPAW